MPAKTKTKAPRKASPRQTLIEDPATRTARALASAQAGLAGEDVTRALEVIEKEALRGRATLVVVSAAAAEVAGDLRSRGYRAAHIGGGRVVIGW
jgi:hypothetical protein